MERVAADLIAGFQWRKVAADLITGFPWRKVAADLITGFPPRKVAADLITAFPIVELNLTPMDSSNVQRLLRNSLIFLRHFLHFPALDNLPIKHFCLFQNGQSYVSDAQ